MHEYDLHACGLVNKDELKEIQRRIEQRFSKEERDKLKLLADRIQWLARRLAARPFLQVMSGATGKKYKEGKQNRSFSIYTIKLNSSGFQWESERFKWNQSIGEYIEQTKKYIMFDSNSRIIIRSNGASK